MSGAKETPRQKMIGMMYLFYTALLALNIAADVLNAFVLVNDSMVQTNDNFGSKNELIMSSFETQYGMNKEKVGPYYEKAKKAVKYSEELKTYIEDVMNRLVLQTELDNDITKLQDDKYKIKKSGSDEDSIVFEQPFQLPARLLTKKDKYNVPMQILIPASPMVGAADTLKEKFAEYNNNILSLLDKNDIKDIKLGLNTEKVYNSVDKSWEKWEHNSFHHTVLVADLVLLNKYVSEVLNTESEVLNKLYSYIDAKTIKFDAVRAAVIPKSNVVIQGSEYSADIFVAAYSRTEVPTVVIKPGADTLTWAEVEKAGKNNPNFVYIDSADQGIVKYTFKTTTSNEFKYAGLINIKGPDGKYQHRHFNSSYQVIKPTATVSADKMNVVYRGLDNPISVSAPGFTNEHTKVSVSGGGRLSAKGGGKFVYNPPKGNVRTIKFNVSGVKDDGTVVPMGKQEFRVLGVPAPIIKVAGRNEGKISGAALASQPILTATMEKFAFDLKYRVSNYDIMVFSNRGAALVNESVKSNRLSNKAVKQIRKAPRGSTLIISNVKIVGPDGTKRALGFSLKIQ